MTSEDIGFGPIYHGPLKPFIAVLLTIFDQPWLINCYKMFLYKKCGVYLLSAAKRGYHPAATPRVESQL
jgi:hypothetical protein